MEFTFYYLLDSHEIRHNGSHVRGKEKEWAKEEKKVTTGMRIFIRRTKRIFESNNVPFLWNSVISRLWAHSVPCTSEEFISVIYCRPPTDYQADRDIKERPDKTGFNLWSLSAMASFAGFPLRLFSMSKNRLAIIETVLSGDDGHLRNHYRRSMKISFHVAIHGPWD